jgi:tetratricopeptide (TPR) repeat protein
MQIQMNKLLKSLGSIEAVGAVVQQGMQRGLPIQPLVFVILIDHYDKTNQPELAAQLAEYSGDNDQAIHFYLKANNIPKAVELMEEAGKDEEWMLQAYLRAGLILNAAKFMQTKGYLPKAAHLYKEARCYDGAAILYEEMGDTEAAIENHKKAGNFKKAAILCEQIGDNEQAEILRNVLDLLAAPEGVSR